jgi:hypothetical protein
VSAEQERNGMFPGESIEQAAERWAMWCERRAMGGLPGFLRFVAETPAMTDDRIDYVADKVVRAMPDGIRGFCKTWGWQQFARELLDVCRARDRQPPVRGDGEGG